MKEDIIATTTKDLEWSNIISANGDGVNDYMTISLPTDKTTDIELYVYDRYGSLQHSESIQSNGLYTTTFGGDMRSISAMTGVYVWLLKINTGDKFINYSGESHSGVLIKGKMKISKSIIRNLFYRCLSKITHHSISLIAIYVFISLSI